MKLKIGDIVKYKGREWEIDYIWGPSGFEPTRYEIQEVGSRSWCVVNEFELDKE